MSAFVGIRRIAVIGVGLLGGSFAAAVRRAGCQARLVGIGRDDNARRALSLGLVDEVVVAGHAPDRIAAAAAGAELVVLAAPVSTNAALLGALAATLADDALLTDVSSVKAPIVAAACRDMGDRLGCFVPSHPIAGGERTGPEAARADLFDGRLVVMTPLVQNTPAQVERLAAIWQALGARVRMLDPEEHDRIYAMVSHWPHALAFALAAAVADDPAAADGFAGPGLLDQTRIAASSPALWADILLQNQAASLAAAATVRSQSDRIETALRAGDREQLIRLFSQAARWRRSAG